MKTITVPVHYQVWLTDLKAYLDRQRGRKAALARHLAETQGWTQRNAAVRMAQYFNQGVMPNADTFLALAAWLESRPDR